VTLIYSEARLGLRLELLEGCEHAQPWALVDSASGETLGLYATKSDAERNYLAACARWRNIGKPANVPINVFL